MLGYTLGLARVRVARGEAAAAEPMLRDNLRERERLYAAGDLRVAQAQSVLAAALLATGRAGEAEPLMLAADRVLRPLPGLEGRERAANRARLVTLYLQTGRPADADRFR